MMHVSSEGRELIERNEGLRLKAYPDPATGGDPWTIGYGCTGPTIVPGLVITKEQADQMLSDRLAHEFEPGVLHAIGGVVTTQGEFDAMVSLAFNIGVGAFSHSSVAHDHAAGNYQAAASAFLLWDKAAGRVLPALERRRNEEREMYLEGVSQPTPPVPPTPRDHVTEAQTNLNKWGLDQDLKVDGLFGPMTMEALKLFQADAKLPVTGLPDDATLEALRKAVA